MSSLDIADGSPRILQAMVGENKSGKNQGTLKRHPALLVSLLVCSCRVQGPFSSGLFRNTLKFLHFAK